MISIFFYVHIIHDHHQLDLCAGQYRKGIYSMDSYRYLRIIIERERTEKKMSSKLHTHE